MAKEHVPHGMRVYWDGGDSEPLLRRDHKGRGRCISAHPRDSMRSLGWMSFEGDVREGERRPRPIFIALIKAKSTDLQSAFVFQSDVDMTSHGSKSLL
ncbi:hypothetical protein MHYP_G00286280 [Metynnis hypsauchen]